MTDDELAVMQEIQWMLDPESYPDPVIHSIPDPRTVVEVDTDLWPGEITSRYGMNECLAERAYDSNGRLKPIIEDWEALKAKVTRFLNE